MKLLTHWDLMGTRRCENVLGCLQHHMYDGSMCRCTFECCRKFATGSLSSTVWQLVSGSTKWRVWFTISCTLRPLYAPPFVAPDTGARLNISLDDGQERCGISSRNKLHKESSSMEVNSAKNPLGRDRSTMTVSRLSSCDSGPEAHLQLHSTNRPVNNSLDIQKHFIFHIYAQMPLCLKRSKTAKIIL